MRPIKLKIQAFGPYAQQSIIDFSLFEDNAIFLITGNTGAGKTAIFDAISYALYGKPSGYVRSSDMLRNSSADSGTKTYVQLTFEYYDQQYQIYRSPRYMRNKARGEGETEEPAQAELTLPTGEIISGLKQVDEKMHEILKITQEQFSQIVMIAQNDFRKFLSSNTSDRKDILRTIFATSTYETFENELKLLTVIKKDAFEKEKALYESLISNFKSFEESFYEQDDYNHESIQKIVREALKESYELKKKQEAEKVILEKELNENTKALALAQKNNDVLKQYKIYEESYVDLIKDKDKINEVQKKLNLIDLVRRDFLSVDSNLNESIKALTIINNEYDRNHKQLIAKQEHLKELEIKYEQLPKLKLEHQDLIKQINTLENLVPQYEEAERLNKTIKDNDDTLKTLRATIKSSFLHELKVINKLEEDYDEHYEKYGDIQKQYTHTDNQFNHLEHLFLTNQAGLLASQLKDEEPCPVCGSKTHPNKVSLPSEDIEQQYFAAKNQYQSIQKQRDTFRDKLEKEKVIIQKHKSIFESNSVKMFDEIVKEEDLKGVVSKESSFDEVSKSISKYRELKLSQTSSKASLTKMKEHHTYDNLESLNNDLAKLNKDANDLNVSINTIEKSYATIKEEVVILVTNETSLSKSVASHKDSVEKLEVTLDNLVSEHFESKEQYYIIKQKVSEREVLEKHIKDFETQLSKVTALYEDYKKQSESLVFQNTEELEKKEESLNLKVKQITESLNEINNTAVHNEQILEKLEKAYTSIADKEKEYQDYVVLSNTASGTLPQKAKIQFETYAQMAYFDRVIYYANQRLTIMSNNQYELVRREDPSNLRSQGGLDLDIMDHHFGTVRDVATLSGGESFNTSLALALGLSDAIQYGAGGIKIDALFIDEGFGSLSDDYLDNAIQTLNDVAGGNRLIGVISHVKELRDAIENQIQVTKDDTGSHIKIIST